MYESTKDIPRIEVDKTTEDDRSIGIVFAKGRSDELMPGEFKYEVLIGLWKWAFAIGIGKREESSGSERTAHA